jgi:putative colanic acid biosysnthesis UDP-glucose lipid carrier transferase
VNQVTRSTTQVIGAVPRRLTLSYQSLQAVAVGLDACALLISGVLGFALYQHYSGGAITNLEDGLGIGTICGFLFVVLAHARRLYQRHVILNPWPSFKCIWLILAVAYLGLINFMFLLKVGQEYSRGSVIIFGVFAAAFVTFERLALAHFAAMGVQRGLIAGRKAVIIGEASELERLPSSQMRHFGTEEIARIGVTRGDQGQGLGERGRAQVAGAISLARELHAAEFVLMIPWGRDRLIAEIGELLRVSPLAVKLLPDATIRSVIGRRVKSGFDPTLAVEIQRAPLSRWERLSKRTLDLLLSAAAVVLLAPLLLMTALAIKLDSKGPVLFRQRRVGFDNREFVIFKFRSMTTLEDGERLVQARRGDSRITRIGRLLRRSSIDELPQLLNVIRGDMSLVGPRPHAVAHHDQYGALISSYALRHHVKPGLTGLAQMKGFRGETRQLAQMERRVEQDLWYINHWSLALDLMIMARTCLVLLRHEAY